MTHTADSKALRLARYLKEFVNLRRTTILDVDRYESVLWFGDMPQEADCRSPSWNDEFEPSDPWLQVHKQEFPRRPVPPEIMLPWIDEQALRQATAEMPSLRPTKLEPDLNAKNCDDEDPPLVERHISDYPEVISSYERYRQHWQAWSDEYRRREAIQKVYADLFHLHTQVQKQGEILELVLGLGLIDWPGLTKERASIRRHVVTARVDLHFDPKTGIIRLDGAADGVQLRIEDDMLEAELRPERSERAIVEDQLKAIDDDIWDRPRMFAALKSWAEALHAGSEWSPALQPETGLTEKPRVTFAPALILRKRTQRGMVGIYNAIIEQLSATPQDVPFGWSSLINFEDDRDHDVPPVGKEVAKPSPDANSKETYFPLPSNREQRRIVEGINQRRGVLVQGPPGTGKSHTIANLVCHLLATGKRVLITAETDRALRVLKEKLPAAIQPLCISLLGQSGDAFAELNTSVQGITTRYDSWHPGSYDARIAEIDRELAGNRRSVAEIDTELLTLRAAETSPHSLMNGAYQGTASAIAQRIAKERERFAWLQLPREACDDPPIAPSDLLEWVRIRRSYNNKQIADAKLRTVDSETLPSPELFAAAVVNEQETKQAVQQLAELQKCPVYRWIVALNSSERAVVDRALRMLNDRRRDLFRRGYSWTAAALTAALGERRASWQALLDESQALIVQVDQLRSSLGYVSISIPPEMDTKVVRGDAEAVINHLRAGGKWTIFGWEPRAVKGRGYLRERVSVDGQSCDTADRLLLVCKYVDLCSAFSILEQHWPDRNDLPQGSNLGIRLEAIKEQVTSLELALGYADACVKLAQTLNEMLPGIPAPDWLGGEVETWIEIVRASKVEERHRLATNQVVDNLANIKRVCDLHDAHPVVASLGRAIEQRSVTGYSQAYYDLCEVEQTRRDQELRCYIETALERVVPGLANAVASGIEDTAWDERFDQWEQAWRWAIADNWLRKRSDFLYQEQLWQRRRRIDKQIAELLTESAAQRAWTHFFNRLSPKEAQALKSWREAVRAIGKGTGRSARIERLRREAREYMNQCREAIPVWIMPRYLVAEMVTPGPNRYDLVIVDEASQLGIDSLFLFYIARKMLIVGDDQQISPYGVGISDEAIANLQHHYLEGIPHHNALLAQSSLYANAKIRFGQNIVLREHFRCMPEIIQFSNDLCYAPNGTPLDPLRAYQPNRLHPLVLHHVKNGYRSGSADNAVNEPEADAVVSQIVACIDDPRYAGRTMGVISLQGEAQARLIERKLLEKLEPEIIEGRRLICGDAYAFQGDERNIIFLSFVAAPNERIGTLSNESARQRFNVAASRAQDQLWLFHSANLIDLSDRCMRYRLLKYMLAPVRQTPDENIDRCESQFERDVFRLVRDKGFHVRTQVCVGDPTNHRYRIDLVVEGMHGHLAVECDGDEWHGAERYEQDMARQRDLERAGWQFVRIRGGDFYRDRTKAMEPLWAELDRLGIKPGGVDEAASEPPPAADGQWEERKGDGEATGDEERACATDGGQSNRIYMFKSSAREKLRAFASDLSGSRLPERFGPWYPTGVIGPETNPPHNFPREKIDEAIARKGFQLWRIKSEPSRPASTDNQEKDVSTTAHFLAEYISYQGAPAPDPRTVNISAVSDGLFRIIEVEGPMLAKRAYDIYLRGCNIQRLGGELKSVMNKALMSAIRQGRVISENEPNERGLIFSTVRIKGSPPIKPRRRGPRAFEEIPPGELRYAGQYVLEQGQLRACSDEHLRAILDIFDLKRLTTAVGTTMLEILERRDERVDNLLIMSANQADQIQESMS